MSGYFVEGFDICNKREVLRWLREDFDGDRWGWAMSVAFDIAAELYNRDASMPFDDYQPANICGDQEVSEYRAEGMKEIPSTVLYDIGAIINLYLDECKSKGLDY